MLVQIKDKNDVLIAVVNTDHVLEVTEIAHKKCRIAMRDSNYMIVEMPLSDLYKQLSSHNP